MEEFSKIGAPVRIPLAIETPGFMMDHRFIDKPVLPAVEAMEALARATTAVAPDCRINTIRQARFDKFLFLDSARTEIEGSADIQATGHDGVQAALVTRSKAPKANITRTKTHAQMTFGQTNPVLPLLPQDVAVAVEGVSTVVAPAKIYSELVPFGPTYQNIVTPLHIGTDGALAHIRTPQYGDRGQYLLGSPFALDAAFHAACVWAQRYRNIVAFPVAIDRRTVVAPTQPGTDYYGRVILQASTQNKLSFNIWLFDQQTGRICEMVEGVHMRDVSGGRLRPPEWIAAAKRHAPLTELRGRCQALSIVEIDGLAAFAPLIFTSREQQRYAGMGEKRQRSFLAGRLALKRLMRERNRGSIDPLPAQDIETVRKSSPRPCCRHGEYTAWQHCSLSHDSRFAVAVGDEQAIGVDVEVISERALNCSRIYMDAHEQHLVARSKLGPLHAAVRVWSVKEAVTKALQLNLADAWHDIRVSKIGQRETCFTHLNDRPQCAWHAVVESHIVTLFKSTDTP